MPCKVYNCWPNFLPVYIKMNMMYYGNTYLDLEILCRQLVHEHELKTYSFIINSLNILILYLFIRLVFQTVHRTISRIQHQPSVLMNVAYMSMLVV